MKTKTKAVKLSPKRAVAAPAHAVVPLKERRLNFGNKWDYAPAMEDSKNCVIAKQVDRNYQGPDYFSLS